MRVVDRRAVIGLMLASAAAGLEAGCASQQMTARAQAGPDSIYQRADVDYVTRERPGTIVIDPENHFLYLVQAKGRATRYGVGVGGEGYGWSGNATIHNKQEWPDWYPTKEILQRKPEIRSALIDLHGGLGMPGGPENPLGARALWVVWWVSPPNVPAFGEEGEVSRT